ncbi:hypothetical protein R3W88_033734 [Solanum pinnatisectum]|uniref:Transmembrane protein n=1 Tax=Solanum pinnatisectum TaxID=50273 RepID=A0AAV9K3B6_9SOLN|nr:hypothetical protein R3W88_033734 [Solanum pinnatisectum]
MPEKRKRGRRSDCCRCTNVPLRRLELLPMLTFIGFLGFVSNCWIWACSRWQKKKKKKTMYREWGLEKVGHWFGPKLAENNGFKME